MATKLSHHLRELQIRLLVSVVVLAVVGVVVYHFYEPILTLLRSPLNAPLYYSSPAGSFAFVMKICFMGSLAITIPIVIYNLIMFVRPAFKQSISLKRVYATTASSAMLAVAGAFFAFTIIIPGTLHFFAGFQVDGLSALISADSYLGFVTNVIITFVIVFQLPILIAFIDSVKPLPPKDLLGMNKWVVVGSLVISLLVPFAFDLMTSLMIAAPIVVLYNLSIIVVVLQHAYAARKAQVDRRATNTRLVLDLSSTPVSALPFNDQLFETFVDELVQPQQQSAPVHTNVQRRAGMDIRHLTSRPAAVTKAPFQPKQTPLVAHVRMISDVSGKPRANRALTSQ